MFESGDENSVSEHYRANNSKVRFQDTSVLARDDNSSELPSTTHHSLLLETSELTSLSLSITFLPELLMNANGLCPSRMHARHNHVKQCVASDCLVASSLWLLLSCGPGFNKNGTCNYALATIVFCMFPQQ